jgi:PTH1 family peptidyl-tRNA hydrolase
MSGCGRAATAVFGAGMANQCLIAGLGNPGSDYARTRHNAGFALVDLLAERWDARWTLERKFNARLARAEWTGRSCLLCQPQTYMNESGRSVGALVDYHRLGLDQVLVAVDDADLPLGAIRMRPGGSSGGHHGLDSIAAHLGSREFTRLRIGIGRADPREREITGRVLGQFGDDEWRRFGKVIARGADQVECWLSQGTQTAMNQFNGIVADASE